MARIPGFLIFVFPDRNTKFGSYKYFSKYPWTKQKLWLLKENT
jgi:hypothetical protein